MVSQRPARPLLLASGFLAVMALASCGSATPAVDDTGSTNGGDVDAQETSDAASDTSSSAPITESTPAADPETTASSTTPPTEPTETTETTELAPACIQQPLEAAASSEPSPPPDDVVVLLDRNGLQLCLGPALVDSTVIESASVNISPSSDWTVLPVFTVDGIEQFNAAAASCSASGPDPEVCPSSRLAIVDGYIVVSSPTIQAANFKRDQIIISGNFTEAEARERAASLVNDGITLRPVLADLGPATSSGE